jgi:DNA-binding NarL/FixJ family response regulator
VPLVELTCLIVDDNASFLKAASRLLEREGVTVSGVASNGAEALRVAREVKPDVVLLDIMLGSESGFDVARELAAIDGGGPTVVFVSTHAETDFAELIDEASAAGFLSKSDLSAEAIRQVVA